MNLIRTAILLGFFLAIPICVAVYLGTEQLERKAPVVRETREILQQHLPELSQPVPPRYPFSRSISDQNLRSIDVVIVGRSSTHLRFLSKRDWKTYDLALHRLSFPDQQFVEHLEHNLTSQGVYPWPRRIIDRDGIARVVVIHGRSVFDLFVQPVESGGEDYILSINHLSDEDRRFAFSLPVSR